jgi:outer membrane immunogenic protein
MISGANAADVYSRGPSIKDSGPVDYAPAITWTGFYVGAHAGSTFDDSASLEILGTEVDSDDLDEQFIGGLHVGYNWQTSRNLVLGIEGNITVPADSDEFFADYFASIRGRIGYALDKTLVYGTGGVAFLANDNALLGDDVSTGYVVGGGLDHKIRDNVSIGLEGLYYSFEDEVVSGVDVERDFFTVQARVTYHFNDRTGDPLK